GAGGRGRRRMGGVSPARRAPGGRRWGRPSRRAAPPPVPPPPAALPISRQAVAKHLAALDGAGLIERAPGPGREVRYRLREGALAPAATWLTDTQHAWDDRLARLKASVEASAARSPRVR